MERKSFLKIMNPLLIKLKIFNLTSKEWILGMDACSNIIYKDQFKFAYDYLVTYLIDVAPEVTKTRYLEITKSLYMIASYMHRFEIPRAKLPTLNEVSNKNIDRCLND